MLALCETVQCRRAQLLAYFGETAAPCGNCDTCLVPAQTWDGTVAAQKLLSAVYRLKRERGQQFGAGHIIDILLGKETPKITQNGHTSLTVFGIGGELGDGEWRGVVRQLLAQRLLAVEVNHGTLALTAESGEVLSGRRAVLLRREQVIRKSGRTERTKAAAVVAAELPAAATGAFEALRAWRASVAKEQGVPAYVVFHDATLRQIAAQAPSTLGELSGISGVGEAMAEREAAQ
jgi:ATP-dependent DNA helicase RecQ